MRVVILFVLGIIGAQCIRPVPEDAKDLLRPENVPQFGTNSERVHPALNRGSVGNSKPAFGAFNDATREYHSNIIDSSKKSIRSSPRVLEESKPYVSPDEKYNQAPPIEDEEAIKNSLVDPIVDPVSETDPVVPAPEVIINAPEVVVDIPALPESNELIGSDQDMLKPKPIPNIMEKPKPGPEGKPKPIPSDCAGVDGCVGEPVPPRHGAAPQPKPIPGAHLGGEDELGDPRGADEASLKPKPVPSADMVVAAPPKVEPETRRLSFFPPPPPPSSAKPKPDPKPKPAPPAKPRPGFDASTQTREGPSVSWAADGVGDYQRLRSQMALVSSPHSVDYADEAYIAVATAQDLCRSDYEALCGQPSGQELGERVVDMGMMMGRGQGEVKEGTEGRVFSLFDVVQSIFSAVLAGGDISDNGSMFLSFEVVDDDAVFGDDDDAVFGDDDYYYEDDSEDWSSLSAQPCSHAPSIGGGQSESLTPFGRPMVGMLGMSPGPRPIGMTSRVLRQQGRSQGRELHGHDDSTVHREGVAERFQRAQEQGPPYPSYMGFGTGGDQCLMNNYDELSGACQGALDDVLRLREEYVEEESGCRGRMGLLLIPLLALLLLSCVCARKRRARMAKIQTTLAAIHGTYRNRLGVETVYVFVLFLSHCCFWWCGSR